MEHPDQLIETNGMFAMFKCSICKLLLKNPQSLRRCRHTFCFGYINQALTKQFRPEFLNRIDEIIRFRPLKIEDLEYSYQLDVTDPDSDTFYFYFLMSPDGMEMDENGLITYNNDPNGPLCSLKLRICSVTLSHVPAITNLSIQ